MSDPDPLIEELVEHLGSDAMQDAINDRGTRTQDNRS